MNDRHVEVYKDGAGQWRWRRVAGNGRIVADSGEGYANRSDCIEMAHSENPGVSVFELGADGERTDG